MTETAADPGVDIGDGIAPDGEAGSAGARHEHDRLGEAKQQTKLAASRPDKAGVRRSSNSQKPERRWRQGQARCLEIGGTGSLGLDEPGRNRARRHLAGARQWPQRKRNGDEEPRAAALARGNNSSVRRSARQMPLNVAWARGGAAAPPRGRWRWRSSDQQNFGQINAEDMRMGRPDISGWRVPEVRRLTKAETALAMPAPPTMSAVSPTSVMK